MFFEVENNKLPFENDNPVDLGESWDFTTSNLGIRKIKSGNDNRDRPSSLTHVFSSSNFSLLEYIWFYSKLNEMFKLFT